MRAGFAVLFALAACEPPPLKLVYRFSNGPEQSCGTANCSEIPLPCDSVLNVRIISPSDPSAPHFSLCKSIMPNADDDLCAIAGPDLVHEDEEDVPVELPNETLEVQVLVWPAEAVTQEGVGLVCDSSVVSFTNTRFPVPQNPTPTFGGSAIYHPGDEKTVVTLGCTDPIAANACNAGAIPVTATVLDFDTYPLTVSGLLAEDLAVSLGEPDPTSTGHDLTMTSMLEQISDTAWGGNFGGGVTSSLCLAVLEDGAEQTTSVRCKPASPVITGFDISGVRLAKATLQEVLGALALPSFPDEGLVVGIVLHEDGTPASGAIVDAMPPVMEPMVPATVQYLSADHTSVTTGGMTTASGMFVSRDAPYGTQFNVFGQPLQDPAIGGLIEEKVTIVILQLGGVVGG